MKSNFKKLIRAAFIFSLLFSLSTALAQAPQKMSYQAVIRNASNVLVASTPVGMRISILQGSASGTAVYQETQTPSTNENGLVSLEMGTGSVVTGNFSTINWGAGPYFIKTETDPTGGSNYSIVGASQMMSVPYALFAANAGSANGWATTGNAGTNAATNFIGTTDDNDVVFKRWGSNAGKISGATISFGLNTLNSNTGFNNTAIGNYVFESNTTGGDGTANGFFALQYNTTGYGNTASGAHSLRYNTTGNTNTANGVYALNLNTTGGDNTAIGSSSLKANTTAGGNTAVGAGTLLNNTTGGGNTTTGAYSLMNNTTGEGNTANGLNVLSLNTTGAYNSGLGIGALSNNTTGNSNAAVGVNALLSNTTANGNTALGVASLRMTTSAGMNTAVGANAMRLNTTGAGNTASGSLALYNNLTGANNTAIGYQAGYDLTDGVNNIFIGQNTLAGTAVTSNLLNIGNTLYGDLLNNNIGIGVANPVKKLEVNGTIKATAINFTGLVVFADDAAAGAGGLVMGDVYKTAAGVLMIKL